MARIKIPGKHEEIVIFDGAKSTSYKHEGGGIEVASDAHAAAVLASLPDSELKAETPQKEK